MSKYILETTSLNQSNYDTNRLLLGSWCNNDDKKTKIVDYHWHNRNKLYEDSKYVQILFEKYLIDLSNSLNSIHETSHSVDFWRVVIGPWLFFFISICLDRYEMLKYAAKNYEIKFVREPLYKQASWVPVDFVDFNHQFNSDEWNYYLYSEILKYSKIVNSKKSNFLLTPKKHNKIHKKNQVIKFLLFLLTRLSNKTSKNVVFIEVDIPQISLYQLLFRLKSFSFSYYLRVKPKVFKLQSNLRKFSFENNSSNEFEKLLRNLIPLNIPISHIEGYKNIVEDSKKIFPKKTKLMITSNAYFSNEHFKVWCATQKLNNSKLWVFVHGGHHGTALFNGSGKLTEDIADRFYSWGWGRHNLPSSKLSKLRNYRILQTGNKILFISYNISKHSNALCASPIGSSFSDCIRMHSSFFNKISTYRSKDDIVIRLKGGEDLWGLKLEYEKYGIQNFITSNEETLLESIARSELVIVSYDSTIFLEALTLNCPTCLFIRKDFWEMSEASSKFFQEFVDCGILHYDEDSLINHILEVGDDYLRWWHEDAVQKSIKSFLLEYGLSSNNWEEDWCNEVQNGLKEINI